MPMHRNSRESKMTAHEFLDTFNVSFQALRLSISVTCYGANVHSGSTGPSGDERKDLQDLARLSLTAGDVFMAELLARPISGLGK